MSPLRLVNWREVNRLFCVMVWLVAVLLAVVIAGHLVGASSACASKQPAMAGAQCVAPAAAAPRAVR